MVSPAYLPHPRKCNGDHFYLLFFLLGIVESIVEDINILRLNTFLQYICDELDQKMREGKMLCVESLLVCHSHIQMVPLL